MTINLIYGYLMHLATGFALVGVFVLIYLRDGSAGVWVAPEHKGKRLAATVSGPSCVEPTTPPTQPNKIRAGMKRAAGTSRPPFSSAVFTA